jgi:zinc protease
MAYPGAGLPATLESISLDDVRSFYAAHIPRYLSGVTASSSVPQETLVESLDGLAKLETATPERKPLPAPPALKGRTIYLVDKPGAAQSSLRLARLSIPYDALGDFYRAGLMNFNLGGTFDSRINLNLREEKGYTYGIRSGFNGGPELGSFSVSSEINKGAIADALLEVLGELERYAAGGMTEAEYLYLQNAVGQSDALRYETPGAKLGLLSQIQRYDLPLDYRHRQQELLRETDRETLNELASRLIDADNLAIVVVGDVGELRPQLEALGFPIELLDADGYPVEES